MARTIEPETAPPADSWFPLTLGPTILEQNSSRYYSLRYEFKPASIDTGSPGALHKGAENKVTVEFSNNQAGKPKVAFQGNSEDCKDLDAVIFFDGTNFRLERLHRAVKSLRHVRLPGESAAAAAAAAAAASAGTLVSGGSGIDLRSSPLHMNGGLAPTTSEKTPFKAHVDREQITDDFPAVAKPEGQAAVKRNSKKKAGTSKTANKKASLAPSSPIDVNKADQEASPGIDIDEVEILEPEPEAEPEPEDEPKQEPEPKRQKLTTTEIIEEVDVVGDDDEEILEVLEEHSDYEIEDVDVSEDEDGDVDGKSGGLDSAAALRAQSKTAGKGKDKNGSSSESGSSGSSGSDSGSSSSDSGSDDDESASSGDDI